MMDFMVKIWCVVIPMLLVGGFCVWLFDAHIKRGIR